MPKCVSLGVQMLNQVMHLLIGNSVSVHMKKINSKTLNWNKVSDEGVMQMNIESHKESIALNKGKT